VQNKSQHYQENRAAHSELSDSQSKLKKLVAISLKVIAAISVLTVAVSFILTKPLVSVFARPENPVYDLAVTGNRICTIALFFIGFNIFASGMFTALSNGLVSAVLAFSRSFVFMLITMLVLPALLGVNGIWLATPVAELMALALSVAIFIRYRNRYQY
jgi:Na+-driven multidrug efflux pump